MKRMQQARMPKIMRSRRRFAWFDTACLSFLLFIASAESQEPSSKIAPIIEALQHHDYPSALRLSKQILVYAPADYRIWTLQGMAHAGAGNPQQALGDYQHALRLSPAYLPALEGAAQTEFQLHRPEARTYFKEILAQHPDDQTTHILLGILDYRSSNCADAIDHFAKAEQVIATQREALTDYGVCLSDLKRTEDAVVVFRKAADAGPAQPETRYNLALAQWEDHKPDDALETLKPLVESAPISSDALALSAEILESKKETADAVALLRQALLSDPRNIEAYLDFASVSFDHASPKVGIEILNSGLTQVPNEPRLYLVRGILLTQLGEFTKAAEDFETANRIDPKLKFLGVAEGLVKSQQHNTTEALAKFRAAVKLHPNDAFAHYLLAEALDGEGNLAGNAQNSEKIDAAKAAVKLDPKLVAARDLLSSIELENGQTEAAIEQSRAAIAIDPNDQQAVYHLIVALRKSGQKDQLPPLLKLLMELRANSGDQQRLPNRYRLTVVENSNGTSNP